jgi:kinesin family protein C2/C3
MLELYNNSLLDLLGQDRCDSRGATPPQLSVHNGTDGVTVHGLTEHTVKGADDLSTILQQGLQRRVVASSSMNAASSRSHLLFTIHVSRIVHTGEVQNGKLVLCDLGGSEQLKKSEVAGSRMKEAIEINKSLTALGDVLVAVSKRQTHVPYRAHTLTRLLQDSIGGTAKTLMFVTCSPAASSSKETAYALKFASRATRIANAGAQQTQSSRLSCTC